MIAKSAKRNQASNRKWARANRVGIIADRTAGASGQHRLRARVHLCGAKNVPTNVTQEPVYLKKSDRAMGRDLHVLRHEEWPNGAYPWQLVGLVGRSTAVPPW